MANSKIVYQLDKNGYFIGETTADESPLEPGVFLYPAGTTSVVPPNHSSLTRIFFRNNRWEIELIPEIIPSTPIEAPPTFPTTEVPLVDPNLALTIDQIKAAKLSELTITCSSKLESIKAGYSSGEVESWYKQDSEAKAYLLDNTIITPLISAIATSRGISVEILVSKIIEKSNAFANVVGSIIGTRQYYENIIYNSESIEEIHNINWYQ